MGQWLLNRLFDAKDQADPKYAFQGTVYWMRALSLLVQNGSFEDIKIKDHYKSVNRRAPDIEADTAVFENMMMAFHNQASLVTLCEKNINSYNICRSAIINWYYSTYFTCSAMIAASSGARPETHRSTSKIWQSDIVNTGWVMSPFSLHLTSIERKSMELKIAEYCGNNKYKINYYANNCDEAWGAIVSYLSGTGQYEKWRIETNIKSSKEFKSLKVDNFLTKVARELRDKELVKHSVNYLVQSFRYRGKANYRDSIFLSYGDDHSEKIEMFVQDLEKVSRAFQRMASFYLSRRVEKGTWSAFIADLNANSRLSLETHYLEWP